MLCRHVADWVDSLTGMRLPIETDLAFRQALRDGVILCKLLNILRPGTINKVCAWLCAWFRAGQHV